MLILQNVLKSVKKTEKLLTKILEIVKFIKNCKFYKNYCAGGTPVAKAAYWTVTDVEARKRGEQTGLDTLVVHAVNDDY